MSCLPWHRSITSQLESARRKVVLAYFVFVTYHRSIAGSDPAIAGVYSRVASDYPRVAGDYPAAAGDYLEITGTYGSAIRCVSALAGIALAVFARHP